MKRVRIGPKASVLTLTGVVLTLIAAIACINAWSNFYGLFPWPIRSERPLLRPFDYAARSLLTLRRQSSGAYLLGNSRAGVGFRDSRAGAGSAWTNVASPGLNMIEVALIAREIRIRQSPRTLVVVIDPQMFATDGVMPQLQQLWIGEPSHPLRDLWLAFTFSVNGSAALAEVNTLLARGERASVGQAWLQAGANPPAASAPEPDARVLSLRAEAGIKRETRDLSRTLKANVDAWRTLLAEGCARSIRTVTLISPYHARLQEVFHRVYGSSLFEEWVRQLVAVHEQVAAGCPNAARPQLWTAFGYSAYATEPLPAEGAALRRMAWHRETTHFREELGLPVLEQVMNGGPGLRDAPAVMLHPGNVEPHLDDLRRGRAAFLALQPNR